MTWCGKDPGDTQDCGIQVSRRQDISEKQEPKPGPKGASVERRGPGQVPELVGGGHRSCRLKIRLNSPKVPRGQQKW